MDRVAQIRRPEGMGDDYGGQELTPAAPREQVGNRRHYGINAKDGEQTKPVIQYNPDLALGTF